MQYRLWMSALSMSAMALVLASGAAVAQTAVIVLMPDQVKWGPAPGLPADWQAAALMGDSSKAGPHVSRVKLPPNAAIPPHTHPDNENIAVLSGFRLVSGRVRPLTRPRAGYFRRDRSITCPQIRPTWLGLALKVRLCRFTVSA